MVIALYVVILNDTCNNILVCNFFHQADTTKRWTFGFQTYENQKGSVEYDHFTNLIAYELELKGYRKDFSRKPDILISLDYDITADKPAGSSRLIVANPSINTSSMSTNRSNTNINNTTTSQKGGFIDYLSQGNQLGTQIAQKCHICC